jgi:SLT domain-containing protein
MKKFLTWALFIIGALILLGIFLPEHPDDSKKQQEAIALIKKSYTPSMQLLMWNPDFQGAYWYANEYPKPLCSVDDCYLVTLEVNVIPGGEKKTIKAQWLVYEKNTKYQADNTEARTLFVTH